MLCFGLGTLPALLLTGMFAHQVKVWTQKTTIRNLAALLIIGFGIWTIAWPMSHARHSDNQSEVQSMHHLN
jgi:hypothetical protein